MKIFKTVPQFDIMGKQKLAMAVSLALVIIGIGALFTKGVNYGIDFRGGTLIQVQFQAEPDLKKLRDVFKEKLETSISITSFGEEQDHEIMITLPLDAIDTGSERTQEIANEILKEGFGSFEIRRVETVGPKVGDQLKNKALQSALYALAGILIYVGVRFRFRFGLGAVIALFHDVLITMGIFSLMGKEFTLTIVAALLTIIGYSLNDTIVVFDRVRENVARMPKKDISELVNLSINESLSRTILTSMTTFIVVFALFVLGGEIIHDFCFAMLIGLVVGTYSSVFVASPVVIALDRRKTAK